MGGDVSAGATPRQVQRTIAKSAGALNARLLRSGRAGGIGLSTLGRNDSNDPSGSTGRSFFGKVSRGLVASLESDDMLHATPAAAADFDRQCPLGRAARTYDGLIGSTRT